MQDLCKKGQGKDVNTGKQCIKINSNCPSFPNLPRFMTQFTWTLLRCSPLRHFITINFERSFHVHRQKCGVWLPVPTSNNGYSLPPQLETVMLLNISSWESQLVCAVVLRLGLWASYRHLVSHCETRMLD